MDLSKYFNRKKTTPQEELDTLGEKLTDRNSTKVSSSLDLQGTFSEEKVERYKEAKRKKAILLGEEDEEGVDYTHMDFMLAQGRSLGFYEGMTNLKAIQLFWRAFYPYLKAITTKYEDFYDQFRLMIDDQEEVLRKHAELDFKYKWALEFMKNNQMKGKFEKYMEQKVQEILDNKNPDEIAQKADLPDLRQ